MSRGNDMNVIRRLQSMQLDNGAYIPTEDEIQQKCLEIQQGWSERERESRTAINLRRQPVGHVIQIASQIHHNRIYITGE